LDQFKQILKYLIHGFTFPAEHLFQR